MLFNNAKNKDIRIGKNKKLDKYICKDCNSSYYGIDYGLCTECESLQSGDISDTLYIFSDCFSYANGKPEQFAGYTTIVANDRFDLEDKYNIEYINRKAFNNATNNYGELMGVLDGLLYFINEEKPEVYKNLIVISDSEYVILGARERMYKWKSKGWTNTSGEVKNKEVWKMIYDAVQEIKNNTNVNLSFVHQKGHVGKSITKEQNHIIYLQEKCDTLSVELKNQILEKRKK